MKDYIKIIRNLDLFKGKKITVFKLKGGLTNLNFKIVLNNRSFVARFALSGSEYLGINRLTELNNYKVASQIGIGPKPIKYYPSEKLLIIEYFPGTVMSFKEAKKPIMIKKASKYLRRLHGCNKFIGRADLYKVTKNYFSLVKNKWQPAYSIGLRQDLETIKNQIGKIDLNSCCHLDLFPPNIIVNKKDLKFIDWEYSAISDYRYDLGCYSAFSRFTKKEDKLLLKYYNNPSIDLKTLRLFKAITAIREIAWDIVSANFSQIDFDYKAYALKNYRIYKKIRKEIL